MLLQSWMRGVRSFLRSRQTRRGLKRQQPILRMASVAETFEIRQYPAATLTATFSAGLLNIEGTNNADTITVQQVNNRISVTGLRIKSSNTPVDSVDATQVQRISINGLNGNDTIRLMSGGTGGLQDIRVLAVIDGGAGNDNITGGAGNDLITGGVDNDVIKGSRYKDYLVGGAGSDRFLHSAGNDDVIGGTDPDHKDNDVYMLDGTDLADQITITGTQSDSTSNLEFDVDIVTNAILTSHSHISLDQDIEAIGVRGLGGNDTMTASFGQNARKAVRFEGNDGNDTIDVRGLPSQATLIGGNGDDLLSGGSDNDTLDGGDGDDTLVGGAGNDSMLGGIGNDYLSELNPWDSGNDTMIGQDGNDTLNGGIGDDMLIGRYGDDARRSRISIAS